MLLHLTGDFDVRPFDGRVDLQRIVNIRQVAFRKFGIERRPDDLRNSTNVCGCDHLFCLFFQIFWNTNPH